MNISNRTINIIFSAIVIIFFVIPLLTRSIETTTVLVQAGHEGREKGDTGSSNGEQKEVEWNIMVADKVTQILKSKGINTKRVGVDIPAINTQIAVAIHFDGASTPCTSGASVGYDDVIAKDMAQRWKDTYQPYFPFGWHDDNFTGALKEYYGYNQVYAQKGFLVLELGEITCDRQVEWLEPRRDEIALKIANFIEAELKK
ncbi:MAG: hypothetical protein FNT15_07295 [Sulfurovum sp.]|nr:MAG: hypothetical protein FNT15_07295 [Sulfurovum sp.]